MKVTLLVSPLFGIEPIIRIRSICDALAWLAHPHTWEKFINGYQYIKPSFIVCHLWVIKPMVSIPPIYNMLAWPPIRLHKRETQCVDMVFSILLGKKL